MRVLVVSAHPDDTEFISGGTVASFTERGDEVRYLVVTSGERGLPPDAANPYEREQEQRKAARALGVLDVEFLREPDGEVQDTPPLRKRIVTAIRTHQPELVIAHSPVYNLSSVRYSHSDHVAAGRATLAAVFPESRNVRYYPDTTSSPWTVPEIWLCGVEKANFAVDITRVFDRKMAAVGLHGSQMRHFHNPDKFFREWAREVAERHSLTGDVLAEEFHRISAA
jgi:LmbE family N-acetylglucosaminyl deacetylase